MTLDLFPDEPAVEQRDEPLAPGAMLLRGFARARALALLEALGKVTAQAPFRFLTTPGGYQMSVAMTNCGAVGWIRDRTGYRYGAQHGYSSDIWHGLQPRHGGPGSLGAPRPAHLPPGGRGAGKICGHGKRFCASSR